MVDEAERTVESWVIAEALARLSDRTARSWWSASTRADPSPRRPNGWACRAGTVKSRTHYALRSLKLVLEELGVTQ